MFVPPLISTLGDAFAALCVVALPLWILGVPGNPGPPGNESAYARGWKMGLHVIWVYPVVWLLNLGALWGVRWFAAPSVQQDWQSISRSFGAFILLVALARLGWAIKILSKN